MTRRRLLGSTAIVAGLSACGIIPDIKTLAPEVVQYVANISNALKASLAEVQSLGGSLPAGWADTIGKIGGWVSDINGIASGINTGTLVSTAGNDVAAIVHDFNQIVTSIITSPAIAALVAPTGFGWALSLGAIVLPLVEQAVDAVIAIVKPPTPTPAPVAAKFRATHPRFAAPFSTTIDPATANEMLHAIAAGAR